MTEERCYAVLTGDIIKSSRLAPGELEKVRSSLLKTVEVVKSWKRGLIKGKLQFFRGDAWQLLLARPSWAWRTALFVRASLLAQGVADTRIAIGIGRVEKVSSRNVSLSTGEAFVLSGHALDSRQPHAHLTIAASARFGSVSNWLRVVAELCDVIIDDWSERQAEVVAKAILPEGRTHDEIAAQLHLPVARQVVTKTLAAAKWNALSSVLRQFEAEAWE